VKVDDEGLATVTGIGVAVPVLLAASRATAVSVCGPFVTPVVVSQVVVKGADVTSDPRLAPSSLN
jgi:hypothetical protein